MKISIIVPTFNHAEFLGTALESIRAQTVSNWEAIVVNNFSTDNTLSVVASFRDERIRLLNFYNNGIIAASRNFGLRHAKGPLVAFLDSDDFWYPDKLSRCIGVLDDGYDLVCHAEIWSGPGSRRRAVRYGPQTRATYDSLLFDGNCLSTSAVVVRKELLDSVKGFSEEPEFVTAEDYDLWLRLTKNQAKIAFVDDVLGEYRIHQNNQSRGVLRNMYAVMHVYRRHVKSLENYPTARRLHKREAIILYSGARALQESGSHDKAREYFLRAIRKFPWVFRFYAAMFLNAIKLNF